MDVELARESEGGLQITTGYFRSTPEFIGDIADFDLRQVHRNLDNQLDIFNQRGSGWNLLNIAKFVVHSGRFNPLVGSSYIETPQPLKNKKALVNVKNDDEKCFQWAILSALYPVRNSSNRVSSYLEFVDRIDCAMLTFPVKLPKI
jgi:hypothetical protein